ncbi:hypothetical protein ACHAXT_005511 [Thalassiosira profunda]
MGVDGSDPPGAVPPAKKAKLAAESPAKDETGGDVQMVDVNEATPSKPPSSAAAPPSSRVGAGLSPLPGAGTPASSGGGMPAAVPVAALPSTPLKSGLAHWDSVKSRLLAAAASDRPGAARMLEGLQEKLSSDGDGSSGSAEKGPDDNREEGKPAGNQEGDAKPTAAASATGSSERSLALSVLLPALSKILVGPNGKASQMLHATKEKKKDVKKEGKKKGKAGKKDKVDDADEEGSTLHPKKNQGPSKTQLKAPRCHVPPSSNAEGTNGQLRQAAVALLEQMSTLIAGKLPAETELFRRHAPAITTMAVHILIEDYEENALAANAMLAKLARGQKLLGGEGGAGEGKGKEYARTVREGQAVVDFVSECYKGWARKGALERSAEAAARTPSTGPLGRGSPGSAAEGKPPSSAASTASSPASTMSAATAANPKAAQSLPLLAELPSTVTLLFQLHPKLLKLRAPGIVPPAMGFLRLVPPPVPGGAWPETTPGAEASALSAAFAPSVSTPRAGSKGKKAKTPKSAATTPASKTAPAVSPAELARRQRHHRTWASRLLSAQSHTLSLVAHLLRTPAPPPDLSHALAEADRRGSLGGGPPGPAACALQLLRACPPNSVPSAAETRRELLASARHIFATEYRRGFYPHVDALLDERLLLGPPSRSGGGRGGDTTGGGPSVQTLGYSLLAEIVHHVRSKLTTAQLARAVRIFSRVLHDDACLARGGGGLGAQITAAKLLVHLVDAAFHNRDPNPQAGRDLLQRILGACLRKFEVVQGWVPPLLAAVEREAQERRTRIAAWESGGDPFADEGQPTWADDGGDAAVRAILFENGAYTSPAALLRDVQLLLRPLVHGTKTLFWCISSYSHQREKERQKSALAGEEEWPLPAYALRRENDEASCAMLKMTKGERGMVARFVRAGLPCLRAFRVNVAELDRDPSLSTSEGSNAVGGKPKRRRPNPRHREVLESFAVAFTSLESYNFRTVVSPHLPFLMEAMAAEEDNVLMFSHLLLTTGKAVSYEFAEVLFVHLMEHLDALGEYEAADPGGTSHETTDGDRSADSADPSLRPTPPHPNLTKRARGMARMFGLAFSSLLKYPRNEAALLPHLPTLARECLRRSTVGPAARAWPGPYLNTLRALFRTLSGGSFDRSYKSMLPLLPRMLNDLFRFYNRTAIQPLKLVLVELGLTVPSRLSALLPHLPLLAQFLLPALRSGTGDLVNLALRTLEFWVDNLHPDYLFPILSQTGSLLCDLMLALASHLQPAPYPYGLLCMRLLGKLGGTNRLFLREMMDYRGEETEGRAPAADGGRGLRMVCEWQCGSSQGDGGASFLLPFPLARAVEVLRCVATAPAIVVGGEGNASGDLISALQSSEHSYTSKDFGRLLSIDAREFDLDSYSVELMEEAKRSQSRSAFDVLRAALAAVVDIGDEEETGQISLPAPKAAKSGSEDDDQVDDTSNEETTPSLTPDQRQAYNSDFKRICDGLFAATAHEDLREEAVVLLKGLGSHIFLLLASHRGCITRIDHNGRSIDAYQDEGGEGEVDDDKYDSQNHLSEGKLQPLKPFGCFQLSGPLEGGLDPFVFNESLADAFGDVLANDSHVAASAVVEHVVGSFRQAGNLSSDVDMKDDDSPSDDAPVASAAAWGDVLFENLLSKLCQTCFHLKWNQRSGPMSALFALMKSMGVAWSRRYEVEILHTAMFLLKDTPDGIGSASEDSARFFLRVTWFFFGGPASWEESNPLVRDVLCPAMDANSPLKPPDKKEAAAGKDDEPAKQDEDKAKDEPESREKEGATEKDVSDSPDTAAEQEVPVKQASLTLILSEIASTKPLVRFAVRHALRLMTRDSASIDALLAPHINALKRLLFPKVLRVLPLPNQVAIIEACVFIVERAPKLIPIADQHLIGFLSEILKMISIADGEIEDQNFGGVVLIDKHGFAVNSSGGSEPKRSSAVRASSLALRNAFVVEDPSFGGRVEVPAELSLGVQLRVSTLLLFRAVIRGSPDEFYDAESESRVGNIRPHVIALLFRSLNAEPPEVVSSSALAIRDTLTLASSSSSDEEGAPKGQRLPRDLIQSCIRPILVNLRECKLLTLPLLRGLSTLLELLPTWFNKSLGDKLLSHLNAFTDPDRIVAAQIWERGQEPLIPAAVMDLFAFLPQSSHFVESLIKHTIRLEAVLPRYKPCLVESPFRGPLAKYLSRYCEGAIGFFLEEHRLCNPLYSSLFQDLLKRDDTAALRKYLSERENTLMLLNVCFDRPLAMVRSEKASGSEGKPSSLAVYGINEWSSPSNIRKYELARQDIEMKKKAMKQAMEDQSKALKAIPQGSKEDQAKLKAKLQIASEAVEGAKRELAVAQNEYARDMASLSPEPAANERWMTIPALELQHQGFKVIEVLSSFDREFLERHHDVQRALRWLWRSRGRHYRLLHQEEIPPRYHGESMALGKFLVSYAQANPADTDVFFDLMRIFLQPLSGLDFSFIKQFLLEAVANTFSVEQKSQIISRFSTLLSSEGSEETKIISAQMLVIPMLKHSSFKDSLVNDASVKTLMQNILLNDEAHGPKLSCELLQIVAVLLEHASPEEMADYRKDILKYIWASLKDSEQSTKHHGYLAVCRFISVFDTPSKVILQVYRSLLRDTSEKDSVRAALDVLLPVLPERLNDDEMRVLLDYTAKVMREEANSVPQLTVIWESVTRHPKLFSAHKAVILPYALQSLSLLGSQKAQPEIRQLSVALAKLIVDWGGADLAQGKIDSIVNTLIQVASANGESKLDHLHQCVRTQVLSLLTEIVSSRKGCKVSSSHFDSSRSPEGLEGKSEDQHEGRSESASRARSSSETRTSGGDSTKATLLLCAESLLIFLRHDPSNAFIDDSVCALLNACSMADDSVFKEDSKLAGKLKDILAHLLVETHDGSTTRIETISTIHAWLGNALREVTDPKAHFAATVVEKVWETNKQVIGPFVGALTDFAAGLAEQNVQEAVGAVGSASNSSSPLTSQPQHLPATPTIGIYEAACGLGLKPSTRAKDVQICNGGFKNQIVIEEDVSDASLKSLVLCMRLLSSSDSLLEFSSSRRTFMQLLRDVFDSSQSFGVLLTAVSIVGTWLLADRVVLTKSEREEFVWKLIAFKFQGLSEPAAQVLADAISCIVLRAHGYDPSIQDFPSGLEDPTKRHRIANDETFQKLLGPCLLSANPTVQSLSMRILSIELGGGDSPGDVLRQVLQIDFEGLGKRLWTCVVVDFLLQALVQNGGVALGHEESTEGKETRSLPGYLRLSKEESQTDQFNIREHDNGVYSSFAKVLASERNAELGRRSRCIAAIRNLVQGDVGTNQSMLELCFQAAWQCLPSDQARLSIVELLGRLLAKPFHSQFLKTLQRQEMNAVQSTLQVLVHLSPMPAIDPFLLQSLGTAYNGCSEALVLLENHYTALNREGAPIPHELMKAMQNCYAALGERDVCTSISSAVSSFAGTKLALSLEMHGFVAEASGAYLSLIDRASSGDAEFLPSESELELWEQRWIDGQKEMSQWSLVNDFATSTGDANLQLECAWKMSDWAEVRSLFEFPSVVASLEGGDALTKMTEVYLAIHDGRLKEVEGLLAQTAQLCLNQWQLSPSLGSGGKSHDSLLYQFQRVVELRETSQVLVSASSHAARRTIIDMKSLLGAWRHRLPSSFDRLSAWDDVFMWRSHVFDAITAQFSWSDPNTIATLHDRPFACISLGRAARKQGLMEAAAASLNSLDSSAMDVEYAFLRMREQIVHFQLSSSAEDAKNGLNMVNSTHIQYFNSHQKAELFRLKGCFFTALNEKPKANQAYCHSVQICPNFARAWIDWGRLCTALAEDTRKDSGAEKGGTKEATKKKNLYLVQAMGCFLEAVRCDPSEESRDNIPQCLSMLANDGTTYGNLCRTFETRSAVLPSWVWLPWIPQLLSSLCRVEAQAMKAPFVGLLKDHPQALYYALRAFYLERRDIERSKTQKSPNNEDSPSSSRFAEEFMSTLRKTHPVLWVRLEYVLEDLIVRFRPSYEAELLHSMSTLLHKVTAKSEQRSTKGPTPTSDHVEACMKTLEMLDAKFFSEGSSSRKSARFQAAYASLFKSDFLESKEEMNESDLVDRLGKWKKMLEIGMSRVPSMSSLQEVSPSLSWFSSQAPDLWAGACESKSLTLSNSQHDAQPSLDNSLYRPKKSSALLAAKAGAQSVLAGARLEGLGGHTGGGAAVVEIPGQYAPTSSSVLDSRPFPEFHAKLVRFHQTLELTSTSSKQSVHQISMIGSDGRTYRFSLQLAAPYSIRTDERSAQMQYVVRKALHQDRQACRKRLTVRPTVVIPVAQRMRMSATEASHQSLESVFSHVQGPTSNDLAREFQEKVASLLGDLGDVDEESKAEATKKAKLEAYQDICDKALPNALSLYMMSAIPSPERLFQFRKVFASQLAVNSVLQYSLSVVERNPSRLLFCSVTGKVIAQDFRLHYSQGLLEAHEVPFRMTRNITEFLGPFLSEGVFVPSFATASFAMHSKQHVLRPILHLLLRDDVMAWYISKSSSKNDQKMQEVERQLSDRVWSNVKFVQDRFAECAPREVKDAASEAIVVNPEPIDVKVRSLVDAASSAERLCMMPASYAAWI